MDAPPISPDETPTPGPGTGPPPTGPPAPEPRRSPRRLHRSADDRVLGGVAGGIADHFDIDPLFVRLGFVLTAFFGGIGVVAYLVAWVVLPVAPATSALPSATATPTTTPSRHPPAPRVRAGGARARGRTRELRARVPRGGRLLAARADRDRGWRAVAAHGGALRSSHRTRCAADPRPRRSRCVRRDRSQPGAVAGAAAPIAPSPTEAVPAPVRPPRPPKPPKPKSNLGAITASALLVLAGGAWLLDLSGAVDVDLGTVFALGVGCRRHRARHRARGTGARTASSRSGSRSRSSSARSA